jgi:hypothetical protein
MLFVAQTKSTSFKLFIQSKYSKNVATISLFTSCDFFHQISSSQVLLGNKDSNSSINIIEFGGILLKKSFRFLVDCQNHIDSISTLERV